MRVKPTVASKEHAARLTIVVSVIAVGVLGYAGVALSQRASPAAWPSHAPLPTTALELLGKPIADTVPNAAQLRRGRYLVAAGDCISCHARPGGAPLEGGLGLKTPFGTIYSANITPDNETGIGAWTPDQFYRAMHEGIDAHGRNLYPAFPYPYFRRISREDDDAMFAFLKTTPAVNYTPPPNELPFPLNIRFMVKGWNLLFDDAVHAAPPANVSAEWQRGAYLVDGLGHCGACHTSKNMLGADKSGHYLRGGLLDDWVAPDLTGSLRTGLGRWSRDEIAEFLQHGRNLHASAGGGMAEVVTYSTAWLNDADRAAIATFLKSQTASDEATPAKPDAAAMRRGEAIYADVCSACHLDNGIGQPRYFPPLAQNSMLQQTDPTGLAHLILAGTRVGTSAARPSPLAMPSFAWKLSDQQVADVGTYIRNSWGNHAVALKAGDVGDLRKRLGLNGRRLTVNLGDRE